MKMGMTGAVCIGRLLQTAGYSSTGCDDAACDGGDDGDSFYFTPPEVEDPNKVRFFPLIFS